MLNTRFTARTGCIVPIQQAGMGSLATPKLAAAIATAGGLGMVSWNGMPPVALTAQLDEARELTQGVLGVNILVPDLDEDREVISQGVAVAASRATVLDFFWAEPDARLVEQAHAGGALVCWQVGSRRGRAGLLAGRLPRGGGGGGGGRLRLYHRPGHRSRGPRARPRRRAGAARPDPPRRGRAGAGRRGIGSGRALAAMLAAGADGVRIGTRFVAAEEAGAHPTYVEALIAAEAEDTVYTEAFSVGWPDAPHRCLRSAIAAASAFDGDIVGERYSAHEGKRVPMHRFQSIGVTAATTGHIEVMSLWAGESVGGVRRVQPAAEIVRELVADAERLLRRWR